MLYASQLKLSALLTNVYKKEMNIVLLVTALINAKQ